MEDSFPDIFVRDLNPVFFAGAVETRKPVDRDARFFAVDEGYFFMPLADNVIGKGLHTARIVRNN